MSNDRRIEWLCENVPAFKPAYDQAEKARLDTEENRKRMAERIRQANRKSVEAQP